MADWRYEEAKAVREALERIADALERMSPPPKKPGKPSYPKRLN